MPKEYLAEARERSVRMALDHVADCPPVNALAKVPAPKQNIDAETLRKWAIQGQIDADEEDGSSSVEL